MTIPHAYKQRGLYGNRNSGLIDPKALSEFNPRSIDDLVLWISQNGLSVYSNNDAVSSWEDLSGSDNDAVQVTADLQPIYKTNQVNGHSAVYFDASNDEMITSLSLSAVPYSIFIVYNYESTASAYRRALQGSTNWLIGPYTGYHRLYNGAFITGPEVVQSEYVCATVIASASGHSFRINAENQGSNTRTTSPGTIGLGHGGAGNEPLDGHIAEVIIYSNNLSDVNRNKVETFLMDKYTIL